MFKKTPRNIPCVYLFSIGQVKNLRKTLGTDKEYNDDYVYRCGMTDNLERRTGEHEKTFRQMKNTNLEFIYSRN